MTCVVDLALEGISRHHRVCLGGVDHAYVTLVFLFASADRATRSLASRGTHHRSTVHGRTEECNRCHVQFHRSIRLHVSVNQLFRRNQTATGIFNSRSPGLTQLDERCDRVVKKQGKAAETRMEYTVRPKHLPASSSSRTPGFVVRRPPFLVPVTRRDDFNVEGFIFCF